MTATHSVKNYLIIMMLKKELFLCSIDRCCHFLFNACIRLLVLSTSGSSVISARLINEWSWIKRIETNAHLNNYLSAFIQNVLQPIRALIFCKCEQCIENKCSHTLCIQLVLQAFEGKLIQTRRRWVRFPLEAA